MSQLKRIVNKKIGDLLFEKGIINKNQLDQTLREQKLHGGLFGMILVKLGYATEEQIAQVITVQYGLPYLPLANYEIDKNIFQLIPKEISKKYCMVAIDKLADTLTVAAANPLNSQGIEDIEKLTKCNVQIFVSTMTDINEAIEKYY